MRDLFWPSLQRLGFSSQLWPETKTDPSAAAREIERRGGVLIKLVHEHFITLRAFQLLLVSACNKKIWFHAGSLNVNQVFLFAGLPAPNFQPKALWILIWGPCFVSRLLCVTYSERGKVAAAPLPPLGGDTERKSAAFLPSLGLDRKGARRHLRKWHRSFLFRLNSCSSLRPSVRRPHTPANID